MATVGSLVFEMSANVARLQQDMAKARGTVESTMSGIQSAANTAKAALAALGVGLSFAAFEGMIKGAIDAENALHELSLRTGESVEVLSALKGVAKAAGTDMDTVAGLTNKLEKNMLEFARGGGGKAATAFQELGFSSTQAKNALQSGDIAGFLQKVAVKLADMESGAQRAAYAQELFGKSGAALLPFLMQLAKTGELAAKVTTEQAEAAHKFHENLVKLETSSNKLKTALANELLPSLNRITSAMTEAAKESGVLYAIWVGMGGALHEMITTSDEAKLVSVQGKIAALQQQMNQPNLLDSQKLAFQRQYNALVAEEAALAKKIDAEKLSEPKSKLKTKIDIDGKDGKGGKTDSAAAAERARMLAQDTANVLASVEVQTAGWDAYYKELARMGDAAAAERARLEAQDTAAVLASVEAQTEAWDKYYTEVATNMTKVSAEGKKEAKAWTSEMKELGFVLVSDAENAIAHWKGLGNLLSSIFADMAKIVFRKGVMDPIASGIGDFLKGTFGGGKAGGGPVSGGTPYLVGEQGPELFVPSGNGTIVPNGASGGGTVVQNITVQGGNSNNPQELLAVLAPAMRSIAEAAILRQLRPGGALA